jgi:hypothetical protein
MRICHATRLARRRVIDPTEEANMPKENQKESKRQSFLLFDLM